MPIRRSWLLAAGLMIAGCATTPERTAVYDMPLIRFDRQSDGSYTGHDARSLFEYGNERFDRGLWQEAFLAYQDVVTKFGPNDYLTPAAYNAGLVLTRLGMYPQAISYFEIAVLGKDAALRTKARWNLIDLVLREERWVEARQHAQALRNETAEAVDQVELDAIMAMLRLWLDGRSSAELIAAVDSYKARVRAGEARSKVPESIGYYLAGMRLGDRMDPEHFASFELTGATQEAVMQDLTRQLETEAKDLLDAQGYFLRAIKTADVAWATAGVYRIGELYERFYRGLVALRFPPELSAAERAVYAEELGKAIEPVKGKAALAYERLLSFAASQADTNPWVARAQQQLETIRGFDPVQLWASREGYAAPVSGTP